MGGRGTDDPLVGLRRFTQARIALGRAGCGLPTAAHLDLVEAHARAKDAVHTPFDRDDVAAHIERAGLKTLRVESEAGDRTTYLRRPDLGRALDVTSATVLAEHADENSFDVAFVIADGLSALGVNRYAAATCVDIAARLAPAFHIAPVVLAGQARVAIGDAVGEALKARLVIVLIGERPGMSAADGLGAYLTFAPRIGRTDAERNCVSNIRELGLEPAEAARLVAELSQRSLSLGYSGVRLKDDAESLPHASASAITAGEPR